MTTRQQPGHAGSDGVSRLLDAERAWAVSLDAARAAANDLVRVARDDADRIGQTAAEQVARAVETRRGELAASTAQAVRELEEELAARVAHYTQCSASAVDAAADIVANAAPWLSPDPRGKP